MGAWGVGPLDNDSALDYLGNLDVQGGLMDQIFLHSSTVTDLGVPFELDHPVSPHLMNIYNLLKNGINTSVTLGREGHDITYRICTDDDCRWR